ncbi:DUF4339 domain-containing protein [Taklimakanibacter albus]|uniref:DUF4339 domain-containing protein n=1 Tax=Taklimakanibacter albus TaxID=2800327 RepID=A0ACC5R6F5_9HYPH|nr:DUF4339 domain-containing protein [Aestuariivirga sp. YIM B02566]MBK1868198.1 DUF4339 domain-containing protein [Aestuariivirga sp. YIM B02566]
MSVAEWFFLQGTKEAGPFTRDQVQSLFLSGTISKETHLWRPGYSEWRPLSAFSEIEIEPPRPSYGEKQRRRGRSRAAPRPSGQNIAIARDQVLAAKAVGSKTRAPWYGDFTIGLLLTLGLAGVLVWLYRLESLPFHQ